MPVDRRLALHEAGHAVMAYHLGLGIKEIVMCQNPAHVDLEEVPNDMVWQYMLFLMAGNVVELKHDPVNGWTQTSQFDFWTATKLLDAGTASWSPPGLADDDEDGIGKIEEYIDIFTGPAFDLAEQQATRIIETPEIWAQIESLAEVLLRVDRIDGEEVNRLLKTR